MLFNSLSYLFLLLVVCILYWTFKKNHSVRNAILIGASFTFYAYWDYRFFSLILISGLIDFFAAQKIHQSQKQSVRKTWLVVSLVVNLGILFFFKYYNFFIDSLSLITPINKGFSTLEIILPLGISFYTFQTIGYTVDVYRKQLAPTSNILSYFCFVSFFPQLVAGPIEKAADLLPQFESKIIFSLDQFKLGLQRVLYGLILKILIADQCAIYVNEIFGFYDEYNGMTIFLGVVLVTIQIYADFSGYCHIAIGSAEMLGIKLTENFRFPLFATSLQQFWHQWHYTLGRWFKEYVYIPLGGNKRLIWSTLITFFISGLWHGASYTFVIWGILHGVALITERYITYRPKPVVGNLLTLGVFSFGLLMFRATSLPQAWNMFKKIIFDSLHFPNILPLVLIAGIVLFVGYEFYCKQNRMLPFQINLPRYPKLFLFASIILLLFLYNNTGKYEFVYFQF